MEESVTSVQKPTVSDARLLLKELTNQPSCPQLTNNMIRCLETYRRSIDYYNTCICKTEAAAKLSPMASKVQSAPTTLPAIAQQTIPRELSQPLSRLKTTQSQRKLRRGSTSYAWNTIKGITFTAK